MKALGDGLRVPLGAYEVGADPAGPAAMGVGPETSWSLRDLPVGPGYRAAVCVQAGDAGLLDRMRTLVATPPGAADRP